MGKYIRECRALGFDTIELPDAGSLGLVSVQPPDAIGSCVDPEEYPDPTAVGLPQDDLHLLIHDIQQVRTCMRSAFVLPEIS